MIRFVLFLSLCFSFSNQSIFAFDIDSAGASSIEFSTLEATLSSRIVHFKWDVDAEKQGDYFIIEKSIDEVHWEEVKRVKSIGNHNERHTYEISEINFAQSPREFFRILRVDRSGMISELDRVDVNQPVLTNLILIPVPRKLKKEITISYDSMISSHGSLRVINEIGEEIVNRSLSSSDGYNRRVLNIKELPVGKYQVVIIDEFGNEINRSLVIHGNKGKRKF
jgi:hypothetical protein